MARYEKKKDFGLGKATAQEKATAQRMADMAKGKPSARNNASTPNKLSAAMYNWAKANMSKLKSPTAAQKKIFEKYKAMVKAGDNPANPKPRSKPTKQTSSTSKPSSAKKPVQQNKTKSIQKPAKQEKKKPMTTRYTMCSTCMHVSPALSARHQMMVRGNPPGKTRPLHFWWNLKKSPKRLKN